MKRQKFSKRTIRLIGQDQVDLAVSIIRNAPIDAKGPLVFTLAEEVKARSLGQNALMWAGPLADIAAQCWANGMKYSAQCWHEYFKREFLPNEYDPEYCKDENYIKWVSSPGKNTDDLLLVASTTDLTEKGFSYYIEQIYAFGAQNGVEFSTAKDKFNHR